MRLPLRNGGELFIDEAEVGRILTGSEVAGEVRAAAGRVASALRSSGYDVTVETQVTDRARADLIIRSPVRRGHPADQELRDGTITSAVASAGLQYGRRP